MNIVDVIKGQLSGDVLGKLSSLVGESEDKTRTAVDAAVPGLLSVLANLASTSSGADKMINALKQVDTGSQGGFGDVLAGPKAQEVQEKGGSLLNILLGSRCASLICSTSWASSRASRPGRPRACSSMLAPLILEHDRQAVRWRVAHLPISVELLRRAEGQYQQRDARGPLARRHPGPDGSDRATTPRPAAAPVREESPACPAGSFPWWALACSAPWPGGSWAQPAEEPKAEVAPELAARPKPHRLPLPKMSRSRRVWKLPR